MWFDIQPVRNKDDDKTSMQNPPTEYWDIDAKLEPLPGGNRNTAFRTLGLAGDLVFKTTRREPAAIEWLLPVFDLAEQSGFIVPRPIKSRNGRYVEQGWTCEPFLRGEAFRAADVTRIAPQLLRFQEATAKLSQRPGFLAAADFLNHERGGDIDLRRMPPEIVALCRAAWSEISAAPKSVVHGDLNAANMIWTRDNQIALVDWDEARVDATLFDNVPTGTAAASKAHRMAVLAWEVACAWHLEPEYARKMAALL